MLGKLRATPPILARLAFPPNRFDPQRGLENGAFFLKWAEQPR
jgi:hypothetical protein